MDVETEGVIQFTPHAVGLEIQARNDPLQSLSDVLHRAGLEHFSVYRGYRPGKIGFLLGPVPNYHYLVQCGHILSQADIYFGTRINGNLQGRSEEHTSELKSLMRISYAVLCLK